MPPPKVEEVVDYCDVNRLPLILGADANAHHLLWGSSDINQRGLELLDFITEHNLHCINKGHKPTFVTRNRKERLDVTFVSIELISKVSFWKVLDTESMSDHRFIQFGLRIGRPDPIYYRNRRKTTWSEYSMDVSDKLRSIPTDPIHSIEGIEVRVNTITKILRTAFEEHCPLKKIRANGRTVPWWTSELSRLREEARKAYRYTTTVHTPSPSWEEYREKRNRFKTELRKAKRASWREYCESIEELPEASRLYKVLKDDSTLTLGPLERSDGSYTTGIGESLELLLEKHFPRDPQFCTERYESNLIPLPANQVDAIVSTEKVQRVVRSFGPFKAAGSDEIFPAMLQYGPKELVLQLTFVIKACLSLGYTPEEWRSFKAVFIPKPGKDSYERVSSWRPISLTSFWLKTMERIIDWHIRTPGLLRDLKAAGQYAYMAGVSTEAAMHQIVARMERTLKSGEVGISAILDVEGAFSHATYKSIINGLTRHQVDNAAVRWIISMLTKRSVTALHSGEARNRSVERGCPQGGVLSPLLWNLVVDELLIELRRIVPQVHSQGFADDLSLYSTGIDIGTVRASIQMAIDLTAQWCNSVSLSVDQKASAMVVTLQRKNTNCDPLVLNGNPLTYCAVVRYLGVLIDKKLTWGPHCDRKASRGAIALAQCRRAVGVRWGLKPYICRWLYVAVIRPGITYGSMVWVTATKNHTNMKKLERIQRVALTSMTGSMRSTPTAALEVLMGIQPIVLVLQELAVKTMCRLRRRHQWLQWSNYGRTSMRTHLQHCESIANVIPETELPCDFEKEHLLGDRAFRVSIRTRKAWRDEGYPTMGPLEVVCHTDGSKSEDLVGAAFTIATDKGLIALDKYTSVFQAEMMAIIGAAGALMDHLPGRKANIFIDCMSALKALVSAVPCAGLTRDCWHLLNKLAGSREVTLHWIPAHEGHEGNEEVDKLAKEATSLAFYGPHPVIPLSEDAVAKAIHSWALGEHARAWRLRADCQQTKMFVESPKNNPSNYLLSLSRKTLRSLLQIITGHNTLNKHMFVMGLNSSPTCTKCEEGSETSLHFVGSCPFYSINRLETLGAHLLSQEELKSIPLPALLKFIESSGRFTTDQLGGA